MNHEGKPQPSTLQNAPQSRGYLLDAVGVALMLCGAVALLWWVL